MSVQKLPYLKPAFSLPPFSSFSHFVWFDLRGIFLIQHQPFLLKDEGRQNVCVLVKHFIPHLSHNGGDSCDDIFKTVSAQQAHLRLNNPSQVVWYVYLKNVNNYPKSEDRRLVFHKKILIFFTVPQNSL